MLALTCDIKLRSCLLKVRNCHQKFYGSLLSAVKDIEHDLVHDTEARWIQYIFDWHKCA